MVVDGSYSSGSTPHFTCEILSLVAVWISGVVQTGLYLDFFWYYIRSWRANEKLQLPA